MIRLDAAPTAFSDAWKQHTRSAGSLVHHLRFDLAQQGRTREALDLIDRLLQRPRLGRAVFANPISGRLPLVLVLKRSGVSDEALRQSLLRLIPYLPGYGQYQTELALHRLGDTGALARASAMLERYQYELHPNGGDALAVDPIERQRD